MNSRVQCLIILCFFCFQAMLAQERDLRDELQLYQFIDADESEDENASKLLRLKSTYCATYSNELIFSHESGYFYEGFNLEISSADTIYYTLDGSMPTPHSNRYTGQIYMELPQDSDLSFNSYVIRARSFKHTIPSSKIVSKSYLLYDNEIDRFSFPVISLITDPGNFFDYDTGIYVDGVNFDPANPTWSGNIFMTGIEWERDVHIQYFTSSGEMALDQDAGIRIHGGIQRNAAQKSLRLYAREEYGKSTFDHQLLPQKNKNEYKRFILRASFGCWNATIIKDPLASSIVKDLNFEIQDYRPVIVFLNGEYWGIQTIRDYIGQFHLSEKYNLDKESVNIGSNQYALEGLPSKYLELDYILDSMDMTEDASLQELAGVMDLNCMINYYNAEIYLNNYDWPGGNRRWWNSSEYDRGKIRWIFYDLDAAFNGRGGVSHNKLLQATVPSDGWPNPPSTTKLLSSLLENQQFRNEFITRAAYLMNYYFHADTIIPVIERIKAEYAPEMRDHIKRWNYGSYATWESRISSALINFARDRRKYVNQHYISKFDLGGTSELTSEVNNPSMGQIYINDMPVPYSNNKGEYFNNVPIRITAVPQPGYIFSHWENSEFPHFDTLTVSLYSDTLIQAVFMAGDMAEKGLIINELMAKNTTCVSDQHHERDDWIEIYNRNNIPYSLAGLYLTDDEQLPFKWKISNLYPDSVNLQPLGFGLFFADNQPGQGVMHCNFKLCSEGETICLVKNVFGIPVVLDRVTYNELPNDVSWGRITDGMPAWKEFYSPTPGSSNFTSLSNLREVHQTKLQLFPNPSTDYVNVVIESGEYQTRRLTIYGLSGTILKTVEFYGSQTTIDISNLPPGIYIVGIKEDPMLKMKLIIQ